MRKIKYALLPPQIASVVILAKNLEIINTRYAGQLKVTKKPLKAAK